jgi:hypothetical protein
MITTGVSPPVSPLSNTSRDSSSSLSFPASSWKPSLLPDSHGFNSGSLLWVWHLSPSLSHSLLAVVDSLTLLSHLAEDLCCHLTVSSTTYLFVPSSLSPQQRPHDLLRRYLTPSRSSLPPHLTSQVNSLSLSLSLSVSLTLTLSLSLTHTHTQESSGVDKVLRIGFISYDFSNHPTAHLLEGILTLIRKFGSKSRSSGSASSSQSIHTTLFSYGPNDHSIYRKSLQQVRYVSLVLSLSFCPFRSTPISSLI